MKNNYIQNIPSYNGIGVYALINNANGKMYIGSSVNVNRRILQHEHSFQTLKCSDKLICDLQQGATFTAKVLEKIPYGIDEYSLRQKENEYIRQTNSIKNGYNYGFAGYINPKRKQKFIFPPTEAKQPKHKTIVFKIQNKKYNEIKAAADRVGESVNAFIIRAVNETMERDNK